MSSLGLGASVLTVLLIGCAATSGSKKGDADKQQAPTGQPSPPTTPVIQPPTSGTPNQPTSKHTDEGGWHSFKDKLWDPITWFTAGLLIYAVVQARILRDTHVTSKIVERAYVDISHTQPGIQDLFPETAPMIEIVVTNHGRTPAHVLSVQLGLAVGPGPEPPFSPHDIKYGQQDEIATFLMPNEPFIKWVRLEPIHPLILDRINEGTSTLWAFGNVVYKDRFKKTHRGGYARRYIPTPRPGTKNNLVFETRPGYNYDEDLD